MTFESIEWVREGDVATITLNRPDRLNSFTEAMHLELREALKQSEDCRAVLLTGNGRGFCAGQDLSDRMGGEDGPPDLGYTLGHLYNPLVEQLHAMKMPVVCAVNGVAAGAGANIALNADIVLAAESAKFIQPFCRLGLIPDAAGTWLLPRLVGSARARGLAMLGEPLMAKDAADWGLIWKCLPDEELMPAAHAMVKHLATQPTAGLAKIKQAMRASAANSLTEQLGLERTLQHEAGYSADYAEGVRAFMEKREPTFQGK